MKAGFLPAFLIFKNYDNEQSKQPEQYEWYDIQKVFYHDDYFIFHHVHRYVFKY